MTLGRRWTVALLTSSGAIQAGTNALAALLASSLLGPHGRGLMVLGTTMASIAALLAGMGTGPALRACLPTATRVRRRRLLATFSQWSMLAVLVAAGLAAIGSILSARVIDSELAEPRYLGALAVVTAGYVALAQLPDLWYAAGRFRAGSSWAAAVAAGGLVGVLGGAVTARSAWVLLLAQGLGMLVVAATQTVHLFVVKLLSAQTADRAELSKLLRSGGWALGLTTGLAVTLAADRYALGAFAGPATVGVYSVASSLSGTPRLIPTALGQLLNREVASGGGRTVALRARRFAVWSAIVLGLGVAAGGWLLIVPVFGDGFADARPLLLVLLMAEVAFAPFAVASRGLLGGGWMRTAAGLGVGAGVAAAAVFAVGVLFWGAYGAAFASIGLYGGMSLVSWTLLRRRMALAERTADRTPAEAAKQTVDAKS
ncbi:lipopolysaccharide biosynthesis protein [Micromonospora sp. NPDC003197]